MNPSAAEFIPKKKVGITNISILHKNYNDKLKKENEVYDNLDKYLPSDLLKNTF